MSTESGNFFDTSQSTCSGTGLITLDVLMNDENEQNTSLWAGGSCGNVLMILSYLGWKAYPIVCLGKDTAAQTIIDDMKKWNVQTDLIFRSDRIVTPIIVERLHNSGAAVFHEFKFKCPFCGSRLPRNRPLPQEFFEEAKNRMPLNDVFYFDRASNAAIKLAKKAKSRGAMIVFEPHKLGSRKVFKRSVEIADVIKYSCEQINTDGLSEYAFLEVQTLGSRGLKYKIRLREGKVIGWKELEAFQVYKMVDSAGAGDWCTAGLIHVIGKKGLRGLRESSVQDVETALNFGQRLAALKCNYQGARGLMYGMEMDEFKSFLFNINKGEYSKLIPPQIAGFNKSNPPLTLCPSCNNKNTNPFSDY
jgi:fructokinase